MKNKQTTEWKTEYPEFTKVEDFIFKFFYKYNYLAILSIPLVIAIWFLITSSLNSFEIASFGYVGASLFFSLIKIIFLFTMGLVVVFLALYFIAFKNSIHLVKTGSDKKIIQGLRKYIDSYKIVKKHSNLNSRSSEFKKDIKEKYEWIKEKYGRIRERHTRSLIEAGVRFDYEEIGNFEVSYIEIKPKNLDFKKLYVFGYPARYGFLFSGISVCAVIYYAFTPFNSETNTYFSWELDNPSFSGKNIPKSSSKSNSVSISSISYPVFSAIIPLTLSST